MPVQSTWLKAREGSATLGENAERTDSLVYPIPMEHALLLFEFLANGAPLTIGVKPWGQRTDSVYSGVPVLRQESRDRIAECLASLAP